MKLHLYDFVIVNIFPCSCSGTYDHYRPTDTLKLTLLPYLLTIFLFFIFSLLILYFFISRTISKNGSRAIRVRIQYNGYFFSGWEMQKDRCVQILLAEN